MTFEEKDPDLLKPKMKATIKPSKKACNFLKPSKMMKEGRTIMTKRCTAYIPNFEVKEDRLVCEMCSVPDFLVRENRCRFFAPMDLLKCEMTRWRCAKTGQKYLEPDQCSDKMCNDYECAEKMKWEVGILDRHSDDKTESSKQQLSGKSAEKAPPPEGGEPADPARIKRDDRYRLIPKSNIGKKFTQKSKEGEEP